MSNFETLTIFIAGISAVIAVAAFLRPDFERYLRKKRKKIQFSPGGRIEIGFNGLGPYIGLIGALFGAGDRRLFKRMIVEVIRDKDSAKLKLEWMLFRTLFLVNDEDAMKHARIAHPIAIEEDVAAPLNVVLNNREVATLFEKEAVPAARAWFAYRQFHERQDPASRLEPFSREIALAYDVWSKQSPEISQFWRILDNEFFWKQGSYKIEIIMESVSGTKESAGKFTFAVNDHDFQILRSNVGELERLGAKDIFLNGSLASVFLEIEEIS